LIRAKSVNVRKKGIPILRKIYVGIGPENGQRVEEEEAYEYALDRCLHGTPQDRQEFREMLVEWFYSGNWIEKETEEE
jgi:hypothetical protein